MWLCAVTGTPRAPKHRDLSSLALKQDPALSATWSAGSSHFGPKPPQKHLPQKPPDTGRLANTRLHHADASNQKAKAPFRFNRNEALDEMDGDGAPRPFRSRSEDSGHKAGQHPRHADAEADDREVLLDLKCFHVWVLGPATLSFCAVRHTASVPRNGCPSFGCVIFLTSSRLCVRHDPCLRNKHGADNDEWKSRTKS